MAHPLSIEQWDIDCEDSLNRAIEEGEAQPCGDCGCAFPNEQLTDCLVCSAVLCEDCVDAHDGVCEDCVKDGWICESDVLHKRKAVTA